MLDHDAAAGPGGRLTAFVDLAPVSDASLVPTAIATLMAFIAGYAAIAFLLRYLVTHTMTVFVAYRVVLGTAVLVLVAAGAIS